MVQQPQQNARSLRVEKVMELVKNETNYCSEEYAGSLEAALKGVQRYLKSFVLTERENEGLDREQLSSLGKLGRKMKELSARYGASYKGRSSPTQEEQPRSVSASRCLSSRIGVIALKELDSLLCKFPIFELTECQWIPMKPTSIQWKWMKTGYCESSTL
jgi:hypothetical protein